MPNTFFYIVFETKRHMVEPLAVRDVVYRYRKIKLMARVQQLVWWLNPYSKSDNDTGSPSFVVSVVSQVLVFEFKGTVKPVWIQATQAYGVTSLSGFGF